MADEIFETGTVSSGGIFHFPIDPDMTEEEVAGYPDTLVSVEVTVTGPEGSEFEELHRTLEDDEVVIGTPTKEVSANRRNARVLIPFEVYYDIGGPGEYKVIALAINQTGVRAPGKDVFYASPL